MINIILAVLFLGLIAVLVLSDDRGQGSSETIWECHSCVHLWWAEKSETCPRCGSENIGA